jgi:hypothetical protein
LIQHFQPFTSKEQKWHRRMTAVLLGKLLTENGGKGTGSNRRRRPFQALSRVIDCILILLAAIQVHAAQTGRILDRPEAYAVAPVPWLAAKYNNKKVTYANFCPPPKNTSKTPDSPATEGWKCDTGLEKSDSILPAKCGSAK